jgi:hypothetical protein
MRTRFRSAIPLLIGLLALSAAALDTRLRAAAQQGEGTPLPASDLVLINGRILTLERAQPEVQAIAIRDDRIYALGTRAQIKQYVGPSTETIDLQGRLAIPGFIESHGHFMGVGEMKMELDLTTAKSWDDIVAMVGEAAKKAKPGEWIRGRGWHQEKWTARPEPNVEGFPTHASLDKVSPNNPVVLTHASGHATFVNGQALRASNITSATKSPAGGEILMDASGAPTGLLRESADSLVHEPALSPADAEARARKALQLADKEALSKGITTFEDAGSPLATIDLMKKMVDERALGVRLWVMVRQPNDVIAPKLKQYRMIDYGEGHLTVRAIKKQIDGALGSRGAWLLEPYTDKPDSTGLNTTPVEDIAETARLAMANNFQLCVHAIGDRANRETLDIYEHAFLANPTKKNLRWRIEHAQHLSAADIPRFGKLGVIASMQGIHCTSDAPFVLARLGPKRAEEGAYVWQKLIKTGAMIANGTDAPVEDVDPIANFYASVTRRLKDGTVFYPDQRMTRMEALRSLTTNGAYAAFEETNRGTLRKGKYADITVLSKDIMKVPESEIPTAKVDYTIVAGKVAYKRVPAPAHTNTGAQRVQVTDRPADRRVDIVIDGRPFTSYIYPASLKKPVLYPLRSAAEVVVTRGFPLEPRPGDSTDHPHHVGHWFDYGDVNGFDFWGHSNATPAADAPHMGTIVHTGVTRAEGGADHGVLAVTADWRVPDGSSLLKERTEFVFSGAPGRRVIDRTTTWTATDKAVTFNDTKEGAFGIRVARALEHPSTEPQVFVNDRGEKERVSRPDNIGVTGNYIGSDGKTGEAVWGTRGPWMGLTGTVDGKPVTLAILDHPSNHGFPTYWHARGYGLFAANPFGRHGYDPKQPAVTFTLSPGQSVTFHHRILIVDAHLTREDLQKEFDEFSAPFRE